MRRWLMALALPLAVVWTSVAQAQMTVDIAKITCRQLLFDKIISIRTKSIAIWLSGYYHGKAGNTAIDIGSIETNTDKVLDYCRLNQEVTVIDAVERALGAAK